MMDDLIIRFFRDDIGGIMITGPEGEILYSDDKMAFVHRGRTNWQVACPPPRVDQRAEMWDLLSSETGKSYMMVTSTVFEDGRPLQIHHLVDISVYTDLYRDIMDYSRTLQQEKDHDGLTGLYNKGKFMQMKNTVFLDKDSSAVFNMDVNNLKYMNDTYGHEAGDRLIKKAADSLKRIESRNVIPFRVGGDEFIVVALHVNREEAGRIREKWENGLSKLNSIDDGVPCVIACGFAFGERGYDLDALFAEADQLMYEDKKAKKRARGIEA